MTKEDALELARPFMLTAKSICVSSDRVVYVNADPETILDHVEKNNLELIPLKGEVPARTKTSKKQK